VGTTDSENSSNIQIKEAYGARFHGWGGLSLSFLLPYLFGMSRGRRGSTRTSAVTLEQWRNLFDSRSSGGTQGIQIDPKSQFQYRRAYSRLADSKPSIPGPDLCRNVAESRRGALSVSGLTIWLVKSPSGNRFLHVPSDHHRQAQPSFPDVAFTPFGKGRGLEFLLQCRKPSSSSSKSLPAQLYPASCPLQS